MKRKPLTANHATTRGLVFEQMESRLALSATTGIDVSAIDFQWDRNALLAAHQGGFVNLDLRSFANQFVSRDTGILQSSGQPFDADSFNLREWIQFESTLGALDGSDFTTIPQPSVGPVRPDGGVIAIGEIFAIAPLVKMGNNPEEVAHVVREELVRSEVDPAEDRLSLTRGRDVYFEVAAHVNDGEFESSSRGVRAEATVVSAQLGSTEDLNQAKESITIAALAARGRSLPAAQNSLPSEPVQIREVAQPLREAPSMTQSPELESQPEKVTPPKQVSQTELRDEAFQAWQDSKLDASKRVVGRPAEEEQDDTANWPVLAALAVGGMVFSSRRRGSVALAQQQPPRR